MKKIIGLLLTAVITAAILPVTALAQYQDVPQNHWAASDIEKAQTAGIMAGMGDGIFGMGRTVTRAEFASLLVRLMGWQGAQPDTPTFQDNSDPQKWYYKDIETAIANGAILADSSNFRPEEPITREEMAVMLVRALGYDKLAEKVENTGNPFQDVTNNKGYITIAYNFGIISGKSENTFDPKGTALREETAAMLMRVYQKIQGSLNWIHGFYAFSSFAQKELGSQMNAVSFGWSQMELGDGGPVLNTTSANGNQWKIPVGYEEIVAYFKANQVSMNLSVYMSLAGESSAKLAEILTVPENRTKAVQEIIVELTTPYEKTGDNFYSGVTIDFECLKGNEQKEGFTAFLKELKAELDNIDKALYVMVQPKLKSGGAYYDGFDFKAIGETADKVLLMAHDYAPSNMDESMRNAGFTTTPVTPFDEVYYALKTITDPQTGISDKSKIVLALSIDSAGWTKKDGVIVNTKPFHLEASEINTILAGGQVTTLHYSDTYRNPYLVYTDENGENTVWYENEQSIRDKIILARYFGINEVSIWRLGTIPTYSNGDMNLWNVIISEK